MYVYLGRVSDPHHLNADPDSAFHFKADMDPAFYFNADPYPASHFNADPDPAINLNAVPDPAPHQGDANLRPLAYRPSMPLFKPPPPPFLGVHSPPRPRLHF
jgi:hypothetical protein